MIIRCDTGYTVNWGIAKLVKALDFDSSMRRFESFFPSHFSWPNGLEGLAKSC